jgi:murein DD-endopeptidase MepM/ murein hydrolase activator NlpD
VLRAASEGAGGNYLVIRGRDRRDYVYMHMQQPSDLRPGDRVETGERIGRVGDTGNADGCHLHFELWTAPGWYAGGHPLDTARMLAAWDAAT